MLIKQAGERRESARVGAARKEPERSPDRWDWAWDWEAVFRPRVHTCLTDFRQGPCRLRTKCWLGGSRGLKAGQQDVLKNVGQTGEGQRRYCVSWTSCDNDAAFGCDLESGRRALDAFSFEVFVRHLSRQLHF